MLVARVSVSQTPSASELVLTKISMVLKDDCFKVPSSQATEALEAASTLLDWCKEDTNKKQFIVFSKWLVVSLNNCFTVSDRKFSAQMEKMWEKYHELWVSDSFTGE